MSPPYAAVFGLLTVTVRGFLQRATSRSCTFSKTMEVSLTKKEHYAVMRNAQFVFASPLIGTMHPIWTRRTRGPSLKGCASGDLARLSRVSVSGLILGPLTVLVAMNRVTLPSCTVCIESKSISQDCFILKGMLSGSATNLPEGTLGGDSEVGIAAACWTGSFLRLTRLVVFTARWVDAIWTEARSCLPRELLSIGFLTELSRKKTTNTTRVDAAVLVRACPRHCLWRLLAIFSQNEKNTNATRTPAHHSCQSVAISDHRESVYHFPEIKRI